MILMRPSKSEVDYYSSLTDIPLRLSPPTFDEDEWDKSHREYVLKVLLPAIHPPFEVKRLTVESYLTDLYQDNQTDYIGSFEEIICDGSSVVPNVAYDWAHIKDIWSMAHDYSYFMHRHNLKDIYGKRWRLLESHKIYMDGFFSQGKPLIGSIFYFGLLVGGWYAWITKRKKNPEDISAVLCREDNDWVLPKR